MMVNNKETTACDTSVAADEKQSSINAPTSAKSIITDCSLDFNPYSRYLKGKSEEEIEKFKEISNPHYLYTFSMDELYRKEFPQKIPFVNGLLYDGIYILAGAPKTGKSFLAMQIAYHVSTGTQLWENNVLEGEVLYLALEDTDGRLQRRLSKMFGENKSENLYFAISSKLVGEGLEEQINYFMNKHKNTRLIIVDTFQKVRKNKNDKMSYGNDYDTISAFKKIADEKHICIILVHHTRKQDADDIFEKISGTNGLFGAADGALILQKPQRIGSNAILDITGRDQAEQRLILRRNKDTLKWDFISAETDEKIEEIPPIIEGIVQLINVDNPEWCGTISELRNELGLNENPNVISRLINKNKRSLLQEYGLKCDIKRTSTGSYLEIKYVG